MGFEPTSSVWKTEILAIVLMVHFKTDNSVGDAYPILKFTFHFTYSCIYLSRYQLENSRFRKLITVPDRDKTFYKAVISAGTIITQ